MLVPSDDAGSRSSGGSDFLGEAFLPTISPCSMLKRKLTVKRIPDVGAGTPGNLRTGHRKHTRGDVLNSLAYR